LSPDDKELRLKQDFAQSIGEQRAARDLITSTPSAYSIKPRFRVLGLLLMMLSLLLYVWLGSGYKTPKVSHEEWLGAAVMFPKPAKQDAPQAQKIRLKPGDSALAVLKSMGFSYQDVMDMDAASKKIYSLTHVRAGHYFEYLHHKDVDDVWYDVDSQQRLHLKKQNNAWHASLEDRPVWHRQRYVDVTIQDSLFLDASRAGIDSRTIMNLVDVFAWDIDFARELRPGDHFRMLYDTDENAVGKRIGSTILAAEFVNQGRVYTAMRYTLSNGKTSYYSFDGKSLRKTYLKAPVKFSRISSRFSLARLHPVLGYTRAHKGVDYAAPIGTPIHAIGDGRITFAGWKGGYGRLVAIRHTNRDHSSRYGHMSKFGRGIHRGVWVKQGQIIGYVGMSGLATGPHLHFEFRVRGRAINPLSVKHPPATPVPASDMPAFQQAVNQVKKEMVNAIEIQRWS